jgi:hypothetical protein
MMDRARREFDIDSRPIKRLMIATVRSAVALHYSGQAVVEAGKAMRKLTVLLENETQLMAQIKENEDD